MGSYTLDQAQKDIAALRGHIAHLKAGGEAFSAINLVDGQDGNTYNTERLTLQYAGGSGITAVTTLFSAPVAIRTYRIHGAVFFDQVTAAGATNIAINAPVGVTGTVGLIKARGTASTLFAVFKYTSFNATSTISLADAANTGYQMLIDGVFTTTASGTFTFQIGTAAGTLTVAAGSFLDLMPL